MDDKCLDEVQQRYREFVRAHKEERIKREGLREVERPDSTDLSSSLDEL
jgi:hypothetical protein